ncbi:MAG: ATP-binding protein [Phototrophicaceae bacterium]
MAEDERRLRLPGKIEYVRAACDFVVKAAEDVGFGEKAVFQSQLAVDEIFTNIVEHGYEHAGDDKSIELLVEVIDQSFLISIFDEAPPFNPLTLDEPNPEESLWERKEGGWGVFFVRQYMDDVRYKLDGNRNRLILEKKLPKKA